MPKGVGTVRYSPELSHRMTESNTIQTYPSLDTFNTLSLLDNKRVWIYSISLISHNVDHSIIKMRTIPACSEDKDYAVVTSIPMVMLIPKDNVESFTKDFVLQDGRRVAMDFINPDNLGLDQNQEIRYGLAGGGSNLSKSGVFWSTHNLPLKSELKAARKRMEAHYADLNMQVLMLTFTCPQELRSLSPEHREAYRYMYQKATQETQNVRK
jgi:hypothetical protein